MSTSAKAFTATEMISMQYYGGIIQKMIAVILNERNKGRVASCDPSIIPPRSFFEHLRESPLLLVTNPYEKKQKVEHFNKVVNFINQTQDILNLKRGIRFLLKESSDTENNVLFPEKRYDPALLDMEDEDDT